MTDKTQSKTNLYLVPQQAGSVSRRSGLEAARESYYQALAKTPDSLKAVEGTVAEEWKVGDVILDLYEVRKVLGQGGMGKVYKVQHKGWGVDLAVKVPMKEILEVRGNEDFVREAETWVELALHPNVVSCFYVRTLGGIPRVFAEYVGGGDLSSLVRSRALYRGASEDALARILDIAIQFAWGLHHAHEQGLVHQDVKPANVMMTAEGVAKVTDFGLARAKQVHIKDGPTPTNQLVTALGFTPAYCSPEQSRGEQLSHKTDVWSWAVSILEMFVGDVTWMAGHIAPDVLVDYLESGPEEIAIPLMPPSLATLLAQCFEQNPEDRPPSMLEVGSVVAHIYEQIYERRYGREFVRLNHSPADTLNNRAVSMLDLGKTMEAERLFEEALQVQPQHAEATYNQGLVLWRSGRVTDTAVLGRMGNISESSQSSMMSSFLFSLVCIESGDYPEAIRVLKQLIETNAPITDAEKYLKVSEDRLSQSQKILGILDASPARACSVCVSPDGRVLSGNEGGLVRVWDVQTGECGRVFSREGSDALCVCFSQDGRFVLTGGGDKSGHIHWLIDKVAGLFGESPIKNAIYMWDVETATCSKVFVGHLGPVRSIATSQDGRLLLSGSDDNTAKLWDVASGLCLRTFPGHGASNHWTSLGGFRARGLMLRLGSLLVLSKGVRSVALSADGRRALTAGSDEIIRLWDTADGRALPTLTGHSGPVNSLSLTRDARFALSGSQDETARLWDLATGRCIRIFEGHTTSVSSVCFSSDGEYAISACNEGMIKVWMVSSGRCIRTLRDGRRVSQVSISPNGEMIASVGLDTLRLFTREPEPVNLWRADYRSPYASPFMLSGLQTSDAIRSAESRYEQLVEDAKEALNGGDTVRAAYCIREARLQPGFGRGAEAIGLWAKLYSKLPRGRLRGGWEVVSFCGHETPISHIALSKDGQYTLSGSMDGVLKLWRTETGEYVRELKGHWFAIDSLCFSHDGDFALSGGRETITLNRDVHGVKLWDIKTGRCVRTFNGHCGSVGPVAMSADGQVAFSIGYVKANLTFHDRMRLALPFVTDASKIRRSFAAMNVWDIATGKCVRTVPLPNIVAKFSQDRHLVAVGGHTVNGEGRAPRLYDTTNGVAFRPFEEVGDYDLYPLEFSADDRYVLVDLSSGACGFWEVDTGQCVRLIESEGGFTESFSGVSSDGKYLFSKGLDSNRSAGFIRFREAATGTAVYTIYGDRGRIENVQLASDGQHAVSVSADNRVTVWFLDWDLGEPVADGWNDRLPPYVN